MQQVLTAITRLRIRSCNLDVLAEIEKYGLSLETSPEDGGHTYKIKSFSLQELVDFDLLTMVTQFPEFRLYKQKDNPNVYLHID